jgi:Subtilisin inhibitor-like
MAMTSFLRTAGTKPRYRIFLTRGALIAACGIAAAGCGSVAAPGSPSGTASHGSTSAGTTSAAKVSLTFTVTGGGTTTTPKHWTLRCDPTGGTAPNAATACSRLLKMKTIFFPKPVRVMCPMIIANARTYIVYGTFLGRPVHESVVDGGCDLARWSNLNQIFN